MSMARCDGCDRPIDTDFDLDCYRDAQNPKVRWEDYTRDCIRLCEACRETEGIWDE